MSVAPQFPREQRLSFACCGSRYSGTVAHYDCFRCPECQARYWALQPRRNGPLVAFVWPGTPEMQRYRQEQLSDPTSPGLPPKP